MIFVSSVPQIKQHMKPPIYGGIIVLLFRVWDRCIVI